MMKTIAKPMETAIREGGGGPMTTQVTWTTRTTPMMVVMTAGIILGMAQGRGIDAIGGTDASGANKISCMMSLSGS